MTRDAIAAVANTHTGTTDAKDTISTSRTLSMHATSLGGATLTVNSCGSDTTYPPNPVAIVVALTRYAHGIVVNALT